MTVSARPFANLHLSKGSAPVAMGRVRVGSVRLRDRGITKVYNMNVLISQLGRMVDK